MLDMRLRLPELMQGRGMKNAYGLMRASAGRMSIDTASRLVKANGRPKRVDWQTLELLRDIFGVEPWQLFSGDDPAEVAPDVVPTTKQRASRKR